MTDNIHSIEDAFLNNLIQEKTFIAIYLVSGIKLHGYIEEYDSLVIFLRDTFRQIVYKSAISTIGLPLATKNVTEKPKDQSHKNKKGHRRIKEEA